MKTYSSKHPVITGTIILASTNIITRIIGFFYRIYLSRMFGAEGMGIIQLTGPVTAMVFAVTAAGMQTAISKCVAAATARDFKRQRRYLNWGLFLSLSFSLLCSQFVYQYSDFIAEAFLSEARTAPLLRVLALQFPLAAAHACINGYFLGNRKAFLPALSQLVEQSVRVGVVWLCCTSFLATTDTPELSFTAWGVCLGEGAALMVTLLGLWLGKQKESGSGGLVPHPSNEKKHVLLNLLKMSVPLSANRLAVNFLLSVEAIRIPMMLQCSGMSSSDALSTYGILTGMAMPVLFFPGAFTGALSAMLLPTISEAHSKNDTERIRAITINVTFLIVFAGFFFGILFFMFSDFLGTIVFKEPLAGVYLRALCLLCPFMYVNGVFTGILQGLGRVIDIFFINVTGLILRLAFVFFLIPTAGIKGYLLGLLVSQLYSSGMYILKCYQIK